MPFGRRRARAFDVLDVQQARLADQVLDVEAGKVVLREWQAAPRLKVVPQR
jgi:hypothetical protein